MVKQTLKRLIRSVDQSTCYTNSLTAALVLSYIYSHAHTQGRLLTVQFSTVCDNEEVRSSLLYTRINHYTHFFPLINTAIEHWYREQGAAGRPPPEPLDPSDCEGVTIPGLQLVEVCGVCVCEVCGACV